MVTRWFQVALPYLPKVPAVLEVLAFIWIGLFAFFVVVDKTIWYIPEAIACAVAFLSYCVESIRTRFQSKNSVSIVLAGIGMGTLWYEMALSSILERSLTFLAFTVPVLLVWQARTSVCLDRSLRRWSLGWIVVLIVGLSVFLPMDFVRDDFDWNLDPDAPRHSVRAVIAFLTISLAATYIAAYRRHSVPEPGSEPRVTDIPRRFSIRAVLITLALASIPIAWWSWNIKAILRHNQAVKEIEEMGGHFGDDPDLRVAVLSDTDVRDEQLLVLKKLAKFDSVFLANTEITDAGLAQLAEFSQLRALILDGTEITDHGLRHLEAMPKLRLVSLDRTGVSDDGLSRLANLRELDAIRISNTACRGARLSEFPRLMQLQMNGTPIDDDALEEISKLKKLEHLTLNETPITDAGLVHLKALPNLWALELGKTRITDAGLRELAELSGLKYLYLEGTNVTDDAVERLQTALPDCRIDR